MEKIDSTSIPDAYESTLTVPIFSYFMVLDKQWNNIFSHSFDFESDEQCETFGYHFTKNNSSRVYKLQFMIDLIQKLLMGIAAKENRAENYFIDVSLPPHYIGVLQLHGLYFIAVYAETDKKFSFLEKKFIKGSLKEIATSFITIFDTDSINQNQLSGSALSSFVNTIPDILYKTITENRNRNCVLCNSEKNCIPKLLLKNIPQH